MLMKRILAVLGMILLTSLGAVAQNRLITGIVTDAENKGIVAASIEVKGKPFSAVTDAEGRFKMNVPEGPVTLNISYIGFTTQSIVLQPNQSKVSVVMTEGTQELKEIVVTSFGVKKQKKSLGYAVGELKSEDLTKNKEINLGNALQGKIAGVNVSAPVSGPSGSSRVIIRGATSANGNNQPLYVVDGIPIDNTQQGNSNMWGGADLGDGMSSFNPEDIASMSVLKGSAASALYGFRGSNGVILITTKKGKSGTGLGVDFSTNATFNTPINLLDWQTKYGHGEPEAGTNFNGAPKRYTTLDQMKNRGLQWSWGERFDGVPSMSLDGQMRPYQAYGQNNADNFYRTGFSTNNTLAISGGNETTNFRLSFGNTKDESILPGTNFGRDNISLSVNTKPNEKISVEANAQYMSEKSHNRPYLNDGPRNAAYLVSYLSPSSDIRWMKNGYDAEGGEADYYNNVYITNPYFATQETLNEDSRKRFIGSTKVTYNFTDKIYAKGVIGIDDINYEFTEIEPTGINYNRGGSFKNIMESRSEVNASGYLGYRGNLSEDFSLDAFVGANRQHNKRSVNRLGGSGFIIPFEYFFGNLATPNDLRKEYAESQVNSLFYSADLDYKNFLYLTLTGRQDWFSTLDPSSNTIFYPSVSTSLVYSEIIKLPEWMSYGKLRAGWGNVGGGLTDPYKLVLDYGTPGGLPTIGGQPILGINGETVPNKNLQPYNVSTIEFGFENTFFNNRLSTDLTFYSKRTTNDIADANISIGSGYRNTRINVGEILNKGVEFAVNLKAVKTNNFSWGIGYNFAYNDSKVIRLAEGMPEKILEQGRDMSSWVVLQEGQPFGMIKVYDYKRDANGNVMLGTNGRFQRGDLILAGRGVAPTTMGLSNDFTYKNFKLSVLVDGKFGGNIYSATNSIGTSMGMTEQTLEGREGGVAVTNVVDSNGNPVNNLSAFNYWYGHSQISKNYVYKSDFVKLRAVSLAYNFPKTYLKSTPFQSINLAFSAHNLLTIYSLTPNIDPETNYTNGNEQGLERASLPLTRSYALTLNVKF